MAHNPQAPQGPGPEGSPDPAGNTQMFRAFVDEGEPQRRQAPQKSGSKTGVIIGVVVVVVVLVVVALLAF
ncbi:hypothetical protein QR77_18905 [Streptomyces sp. 150FB]|jgi:hypothetical protein|uniref:hypothetical protein n=1 Tax=Streptomyces sp. 150FB TaxID=1576605 RepID=UPI0005891401|nr:hypothetical protein [Streptomyces sp. 150FB]KIF75407.1 hypothetical protein QR77_18905 [Streptomyces sp. 150FB]